MRSEERLLFDWSVQHKHAESYTEHYVALVYSDKDGNRVTAHAFPDPEGVTITSNRSVSGRHKPKGDEDRC